MSLLRPGRRAARGAGRPLAGIAMAGIGYHPQDMIRAAPVQLTGIRVTMTWLAGCRGAARGDPLVAHLDAEPRHQVGRLPGPLGERLEAPLRVPHEDLAVRPEPDPRAGQRLGYPAHLAQPLAGLERRIRVGPAELADDAPSEARDPLVPVPVHLHVQTAGQRVHHRGAPAVQPAGCRVGPAAELPARMYPCNDELDAGQPGFRLNVDRD